MEHLRGIMGGAYSESNVRVRSFDDILHSMHQEKVEADTAQKYWGKTHRSGIQAEAHVCEAIPNRSPGLSPFEDDRGRKHYQYNTLVVVKFEVAERRRTTSQIKQSNPINIYGIKSSPSVKDEYCRPFRRHCRRSATGAEVTAGTSTSRLSITTLVKAR
jgi:hypothetical protein